MPGSETGQDPALRAIAPLAARQHGVFTTDQALAAGATPWWLTRRARRGYIVRVAPQVWVISGTPQTPRQKLLIHVFAGGPQAMASGASSLGLWCPDDVPLPAVPEITIPRGRSYRLGGTVVWHRDDLHLAGPTIIDGIPATGIPRSLLDASEHRTAEQIVSLIDACRRRHGTSPAALLDAVETHAGKGRRGVRVLREALVLAHPDIADSHFEWVVSRDLEAMGLPRPRLHHVVRIPGEDPIELDLDWPGVLLDVELDGRHHLTRSQTQARDRQRDRLLQSIGYQVIRYLWRDYLTDRAGMLAEIAAFYERNRSRAFLSRRVAVAATQRDEKPRLGGRVPGGRVPRGPPRGPLYRPRRASRPTVRPGREPTDLIARSTPGMNEVRS